MKTMFLPRHLLAAWCGAALLTGCPGDEPVAMDTGDSTSTSDTTSTTLPMPDSSTSVSSVDTTVTPDDTSTTRDSETTGTTDTGSTGSSTDTGTTDTGTTDTGTTDTGTTDTGTTDTGTTGSSTDTGESSSSTGGMQPQGYAECSIDDTQCLAQEDCVVDDPMAPTITVCTDLDCVSAGDCPTPPPGGTAEAVCADVTGDMVGDCFLDCSAGDTCPTGMECFAGFICAWPIDVVPPEEGYAECADDPTVCLAEEQCVFDDPMDPTISVCADLDCLNAGECPASPPGGTAPVECLDITGDMINDCFLDCSAGDTCPTGMECFGGFICAWPVDVVPAEEGFGDCGADPTVCLAEELCVVDDPMDPTINVCADLDCDAPADCPVSPPGGTAPVECLDITGDMIGDCFLDCSAGDACPTGMSCFGGFICAWPA